MKKTLIALALAALPVASMADVILYGQIKGGVEVGFEQKTAGVKDKGTTTNIVDYGSRIGFKGHEQLSNNVAAIWQLEQKVNIGGGERGFGTRNSFIGLTGGFGTVKAGYQGTPVFDVNDRLDQWEYAGTGTTTVNENNQQETYSAAGLGFFTRENDAVKRATAFTYETPNMGGFTAKAFVSPSDNNSTGKRRNNGRDSAIYGLGATYENAGFFADVAGTYVKNGSANNAPNKSKEAYQAVVNVGYENEKFMVGAAYQRAQNVDEYFDVVNEAAISAAFNVDSALRLKATAAYGWDINNNGNGNAKTWGDGKYYQGIVGADYALSKRTILNGQVGYLQFGKNENKSSGGAVSIGMKHKF